jgi:hypothetical protein
MTSFAHDLQRGRAGESAIAAYLRRRGFAILPAYEIIMERKAPALFPALPAAPLIAPDMLAWRDGNALWIEAKHKEAFAWHRNSGTWVTGIDLRVYADYQRVQACSPWPVWLLFLHRGGQAKDSPPNSPAGLFGNRLDMLTQCEHHRSDRWGSSGMVYWAHASLTLIASLAAVLAASTAAGTRCTARP